MGAFVVVAVAMTAFATKQFKPNGAQPPYYWSDASLWWDTEQSTYGILPTDYDNTYLVYNETRESPLILTNAAAIAGFYLSQTNATSCSPMLLTIDGGSLTCNKDAYLGYRNSAFLTITNGGAFTAKKVLYIGSDNTSTVGTKYVTNTVLIADSSSSLSTDTSSVYMGHQRKGLSLLENHGAVSLGGQLNMGYCSRSDFSFGDTVSIITNYGTITASDAFRIGFQTNSIAFVENKGDLMTSGEFNLARHVNSQGCLRHSAGTFDTKTGKLWIGYCGKGYLELAGNTRTVLDKGDMVLSANDQGNSDAVRSHGELVITNSASLSRGGKDVIAATMDYGTARIALYDDAVLSDVGMLALGRSSDDCSFEVYDNAVVSNVNLLVLNVGHTNSSANVGTARMKLSGNAKVCNVGNMYIGSNTYNRAELEIADNAWFGLCDDAWETNKINVARDSMKSGNATIRLRGGTIGLGIRGGLGLGSTNNSSGVRCTSRLVGYGCITNQGDSSQTFWSRLDLRGGSVTADGEGAERDIDFRTFAVIGGTADEGRTNLNKSGTNGWYAINKGRLIYPNRDVQLVRFVGEYARLTNNVAPKFVNSMRIIINDGNGKEITSWRKFTVELYAPDRTDIPAGLVVDDAKNRRLGVWRGDCSIDFASADMTIRYDQWRLAELKDGNGNYPLNLAVCLYQYDGTKWRKITSYRASEAEEKGYRIGGALEKTQVASRNLGWFAVVARKTKGTFVTF